VYENAKERLGGNREGYQVAATAAAGMIATLVNDACMTPADVIKQRLQVSRAPGDDMLQLHLAMALHQHAMHADAMQGGTSRHHGM
jgi:hypothetical protein